MLSPQPNGTLRRPPASRDDSSSPSLTGMENVVPSFQEFLKRTPPPNPAKPLPPTPLIARRTSHTSPARSKNPSSYASRRSSSVYSRTVSQWGGNGDDDFSWTSADFADEPMPPLPVLQPVAYSASTPHLGEKSPVQELLQPRIYSPLIFTPSPTESRDTIASSPARQESPSFSSARQSSRKAPKKPVQTISLAQAKANVQAPGAVHLLPEELRAQTGKRSRSHEPLRKDSMDMLMPERPPQVPQAPTLLDQNGRHLSIALPRQTPSVRIESVVPEAGSTVRSPYLQAFKVGTGPERTMQPPTSGPQRTSDNNAHEERGRPRYRGQRAVERSAYGTKWKIPQSPSPTRGSEREAAKQYRFPDSPARDTSQHHDTDSDDSIKMKMKLVPRPLFQTKPPAKLPGAINASPSGSSISPRRAGSTRDASRNGSRRSSGSSYPFRLSASRGSSHQRRSTSGSIPISPPSVISTAPTRPSPQQNISRPRCRRGSDDARASAFYPFVASRKGKGQSKSPKPKFVRAETDTLPLPSRPTDFVVDRLATAGLTSRHPPPHPIRTSSLDDGFWQRRGSGSTAKIKQPLFQRLAEGAARYADLLASPLEVPEPRNYEHLTSATVAPGSPHLVSTQVHLPPAQNHLGWSPRTKTAFDEARTSVHSSRRLFGQPQTPSIPEYTHISTPARPLDETRIGLREPESPRGRKNSVFGGLLDSWKDVRAEKRREELKKVIKVVPNERSEAPGLKRRSTTGWM
ncbi:uncharacterized protein LTR77_003831 [Saxophila tyrrhenica]|uniref:Uncharacterized protein n=1 Tax=Saxophila tyrrhenica TaxID=1690608 RepID=A0AAV9PES7_9PEZI|nr:hypothetical protein LTR77_003831 [Saxophila tyrrhenica]